MQIIPVLLIILFFINIILFKKFHSDSSKSAALILVLMMFAYLILLVINSPLIVVTLIVIFLLHVYFEGRKTYYDLKKTTIHLESKDLSENLTAVYVADFQFDKNENVINHDALTNVIHTVNEVEYDMLLLGGDYINYKEMKDTCLDEFTKFNKSKYGSYAVTGNHDYVCLEQVRKKLESIGIMVVDNKRIDLNEEITVAGVEDEWHGNPTLPSLDEPRLNILLAHNPDFNYSLKKGHNIDLMLSGHYHGGGLNLFGIPLQRMVTKYVYGQFIDNDMNSFVTSGVGGSIGRGKLGGLWIRYKAQPEIVIIKIYGTKNVEKK